MATREASSRAAREYAIEMEKLQKENTHLKMSAGGSLAGGSGGRGNYGNPNGGSGAAGGDTVQFKRDQRWPTAEEAKDGFACVLCGRYAQYDNMETGDGICSMECKKDQLEGHAPLPGGRPVNHMCTTSACTHLCAFFFPGKGIYTRVFSWTSWSGAYYHPYLQSCSIVGRTCSILPKHRSLDVYVHTNMW